MKVYASEHVVPCDIDNTLILHGKKAAGKTLISIPCPYNPKKTERVAIHMPNVKLLKNRLSRGAIAIVWSANGYRWAVAVLKAIGIDHRNLLVFSKPVFYIDDSSAENWMGPQVWLDPDDDWGKNG